MNLPEYKNVIESNPRRIFIFSHTKVGKTSLLSALPNNLIIDTEDGSEFVSGIKFNLIKECAQTGKGPYSILKELATKIKEDKKFYDYISIDSVTGLEDTARGMATYIYKKSNAGKNFDGIDVVSELPSGSGYEWLRIAFKMLYDVFNGCYSKSMIITGHIKLTSITKQGKEIQAKDIQLTGKLKTLICQKADAIGFIYRNKDKAENIITFKTNEADLATGARPDHLKNSEFVISELKDSKLITHWDKIFLEDK
jgi:hypothetical protein